MDAGFWSGALGNVIGGVAAAVVLTGAAMVSRLYARRGFARLTRQFGRSHKLTLWIYGYASLLLLTAGVVMVFGAGTPSAASAAEGMLRLASAGFVVAAALVVQMALVLSAGVRLALGAGVMDRTRTAANRHRRAQWLADDEEVY